MNEVLQIFAAVVLVAGYVVALMLYARPRSQPVQAQQIVKAAVTVMEQQARAAGRDDVYAGWLAWARQKSPAEIAAQHAAENTMSRDEWRAAIAQQELDLITARARGGYSSASPMGTLEQQLQHTLDQQPKPSWGLPSLREHITDLRGHEGRHDSSIRDEQIRDRIALAAAIITDLREDSYDPATAPQNSTFAYHDSPAVRAAYLAGRADGTEKVMDQVTRTRTRLREIAAAGESIAAASERHAAALRALRETHQTTAARDEHAAWEAQQRAITGDDTTTP